MDPKSSKREKERSTQHFQMGVCLIVQNQKKEKKNIYVILITVWNQTNMNA